MSREYDDLYARHQMMAALVNVLVHDLRNPLHSATLLIEAMGSPSANIEALRGKLRAQIGKLDALIGETNSSMRELVVEPQIEVVAVDTLLRAIVEHYPVVIGRAATFEVPSVPGLKAVIDLKLVERAAIEIAAAVAERHAEQSENSPPRVILTVDEPEAGTVRIRVGDLAREPTDALAKAPFAVAGGGIRLASARSLAQSASASVRLEQDPAGVGRFSLFLRKAN
ncbi:MAG TPA: hypothetical protein VK550_33170 [Polyangiaceae bacterium]|nr:hypothetical protein [Polyangiaceae bacterium]